MQFELSAIDLIWSDLIWCLFILWIKLNSVPLWRQIFSSIFCVSTEMQNDKFVCASDFTVWSDDDGQKGTE